MKPKYSSRPAPRGFTPQQIILLVLVALLGIATLILAAFVLFSRESAAASHAPVSQVGTGGPTLPPTWTPPGPTLTPGRPNPVLPASCAQGGFGFNQGMVTQVVDGSTIEVQLDGSLVHVSYAGIEIPAQAAGADGRAAQSAREMLNGQTVILVKDVSEQDSSGRLVRYVFAGGRFINYELVRVGLAVVQANPPDRACLDYLQEAQQQALAGRLGVWKSTPVPTRTFVPFVTLDQSTQSAIECSKTVTCSDFKTHAEAQNYFNACNDYSSKLDDDRDGIACENLP